MKSSKVKLCVLSGFFSFLALSCSDHLGSLSEGVSQKSARLDIVGAQAIPTCQIGGQTTKCWSGTSVELLFADALAACGAFSEFDRPKEAPVQQDAYIKRIRELMTDADCDGSANVYKPDLSGWVAQRNNAACNRRPNDLSIADVAHVVALEPSLATTYSVGVCGGDIYNSFTSLLTQDVQVAALNSCVAHRLRSISPGAAGAETLFLSGPEQRELLEITRERAQIAMLQYARLGMVFSLEPDPQVGCNVSLINDSNRVSVLRHLFSTLTGHNLAPKMADDMASAVRLHLQATEDLMELLARSAGAHSDRGVVTKVIAEDDWGQGSWRHRTMSMLFGGDPLASKQSEEDPNVVWHQTVETARLWPNNLQMPFVRTQIHGPEVDLLRRLARECDVKDLALDTNAYGEFCDGFDRIKGPISLYRKVEACLQTRACTKSVFIHGEEICQTVSVSEIPSVDQFENFSIWKEYRVRPEHSVTLFNVWAESYEPWCRPNSGTDYQPGSVNVDGKVVKKSDATGMHLHFDRESQDVQRPLQQIAPVFSDGMLLIPANFFPGTDSATQGFPKDVETDPVFNQRRLAGAISAQTAVMDALLFGLFESPPEFVDAGGYFGRAKTLLENLKATLGENHVTIRPKLISTTDPSDDKGGNVTLQDGSNWLVDVVAPVGDTFWSNLNRVQVFGIPNEPWAASLALHPTKSYQNRTIAKILSEKNFSHTSVQLNQSAEVGLQRIRFTIPLPISSSPFTFVARKLISHGKSEYRLLTANVRLNANLASTQGFYISSGGSLGTAVQKLYSTHPINPAAPAFDAFGFPTYWVPPTDLSVLGAPAGTTAAGYYLEKARIAADEATSAIDLSFENVLQQQQDEATQIAATLKAKQVFEQQQQMFCGEGNTFCNTSFTTESLLAPWANAPECHQANPNPLRCAVDRILASASGQYKIASAVYQFIDNASPPPFSNYAGGTLQSLFLQQWNARRQLLLATTELEAAYNVALLRLNLAEDAVADAEGKIKAECGFAGYTAAFASGLSAGMNIGGNSSGGGGGGVGINWSAGPLIARIERCENGLLEDAVDSAKKQANLAGAEALLMVGSYASRVTQFATDLHLTTSQIEQAILQVKLAQSRAKLDEELTLASLKTGFGVYQRYHQYDLWRAKTLLDNARRQAAVARKAVQAQFLTDLSLLKGNEPFVASPSLWANEVYEYDLNLPAAVGLSVGTLQGDGIYPNKLKDYVGNLDKFVQGFPVARPTAVAHVDSDILTLQGPNPLVTTELPGEPSLFDARSFAWSFLCSDGWKGLPASGVDYACGGTAVPPEGGGTETPGEGGGVAPVGEKPTKARLSFVLDPWARLTGGIAKEPYNKRYNTRWVKFAVNLVGTGILDCTLAEDPLACYAQSFVRYNLAHNGPSWASNYEQQWRLLDVPPGRVEGGKALAMEQWLDPLANGWSKPFVEAATRSEFQERPTDGTYILELDLAPEVRMDRLERVQILFQSTYWVKQQ